MMLVANAFDEVGLSISVGATSNRINAGELGA
jgi:hypothetical protein